MVSTLAPQQSRATLPHFYFPGVQWQTFRQLLSELGQMPDYGFDYHPQELVIRLLPSSIPPSEDDWRPAIALYGVSWTTCKILMAEVGDGRGWRMAYSDGVLEIRMARAAHEEPKELLVDFITVVVDELEIEIRKLGSLTLEREDVRKAIEPDSCFYIQNEARVRGIEPSFPADPPPDIAIESDHTHSSLNKHALYATMGVPELWRYRKGQLQVFHLIDGEYQQRDRSLAFPFLPIAELPELIEASKELGQRAVVRQFRDRLRQILQH